MEATQDPTASTFAGVEPFTGEPEIYPVGTVNPPAPLMRSQTQFHTAVAVQRRRNLDKVVAAVLREAEFAGDAFYYSFPMGGKKIEGPSIGLAMAMAREWSNCAVPVEYYEAATEWVFNAHFVDLERGFRYPGSSPAMPPMQKWSGSWKTSASLSRKSWILKPPLLSSWAALPCMALGRRP
jgi:hypothetical protein